VLSSVKEEIMVGMSTTLRLDEPPGVCLKIKAIVTFLRPITGVKCTQPIQRWHRLRGAALEIPKR